MTPQEARDTADNVINKQRQELLEWIAAETDEVFSAAHTSITSAASQGRYETMVCIDYQSQQEARYEQVALRVRALLENEGYHVETNTNRAIRSINITIRW